MLDIVNPYNILAFYRQNSDYAKQCLLNSPRQLLPFQIPVSASDSNFVFKLVDMDGNESDPDNLIIVNTFKNSKRWVSYIPSTNQVSNEGTYQLKLTSTEITSPYYSHAFCISNRFDLLTVQASCLGGASDFQLSFDARGCDYALWEADFGSGFVRIGQTQAVISASDLGVVPTEVTVPMKCTFVTSDDTIIKTYDLTYTAADPCGTYALTETGSSSSHPNRFSYIEFDNDIDLEEKNLLYEGISYKQRFYFEGRYDFPIPIQEDVFQTLYNGELDFSSANEAEELNIDFYPMPRYLLSYLGQARYHKTVNYVDSQTGTSYPISNFQLSANTPDQGDCQGGRITFEINRVYSKNC